MLETTTVRALLEGADVRSFEFDYVDVEGDTTLRRTRTQALRDEVEVDDGEVRVGDVGGVRVLRLGEGSPLAVTGRADDVRVEVGDSVRFSATVAGLEDGETARVRWTFPGGDRKVGERVTQRFTEPGRVSVVVGATTRAQPAGASDIVVVRVAAAEEPDPTPTPSPTPATSTPPAVGTGGGTKGTVPSVPGAGKKGQSPESTPTPTPAPAATAAPTPEGELVTGQLLGGQSSGGGGSAPQPAATPTRADADGGLSVPPGLVGAAVAALLAAAGFRLDMRRARPGWR